MKRLLALGLLTGLLGTAAGVPAAPPKADREKTKEALRELQAFIGGWKGSGSKKLSPGPRDPFWGETVRWNWRFKGDDCWLEVRFDGGNVFKGAEVRYLADRKQYQLTATPAEGEDRPAFTGGLTDDKLVFERVDPKTKEVRRVRMNTDVPRIMPLLPSALGDIGLEPCFC